MGNGVGIEVTHKDNSNTRYQKLEKICRKGFFHQDHDMYLKALEEAISLDSLDSLELLLVSGDVRKAQPLHLACAAAKFESVDLMLSAGFSGDLVNKEGRTALHMCCLTTNPEAGLCASLLGLRFPKSLKRYDYMGQTPVHLAVHLDNVYVLKALVQIDQTLIKLPDQSGKAALEIAKNRKSVQCKHYLEFTAENAQKQNQSSKVDQDRIMEVWERFFENAFKRAGGIMGDEEDDDSFVNDAPHPSHSKSPSNYLFPPEPESFINSNKQEKTWYQDEYYEDDWFYWIVCYDQTHDYFVVNSWTLQTLWLDEFIQFIYETCSYRFIYSDVDTIMNSSYPQSLQEARDWGWLTFYSDVDNYCQWMNIMTTSFEMFLPLGLKEVQTRLSSMNLICSEDDANWYEADQSCTYSWIMVVADDEHTYYMNTTTHQTRWDPPPGWDEIVYSWNNWIFCCCEDDMYAKFW